MTFEPSQHSFASPEEAEEYGFVGTRIFVKTKAH